MVQYNNDNIKKYVDDSIAAIPVQDPEKYWLTGTTQLNRSKRNTTTDGNSTFANFAVSAATNTTAQAFTRQEARSYWPSSVYSVLQQQLTAWKTNPNYTFSWSDDNASTSYNRVYINKTENTLATQNAARTWGKTFSVTATDVSAKNLDGTPYVADGTNQAALLTYKFWEEYGGWGSTIDDTKLWNVTASGYEKTKQTSTNRRAHLSITADDNSTSSEIYSQVRNANGVGSEIAQTVDSSFGNNYNIKTTPSGGSETLRFTINDTFSRLYSPKNSSQTQYFFDASATGLSAYDLTGAPFQATAGEHVITKSYADAHYGNAVPEAWVVEDYSNVRSISKTNAVNYGPVSGQSEINLLTGKDTNTHSGEVLLTASNGALNGGFAEFDVYGNSATDSHAKISIGYTNQTVFNVDTTGISALKSGVAFTPTAAAHIITKSYFDAQIASWHPDLSNNYLWTVTSQSFNKTKQYSDTIKSFLDVSSSATNSVNELYSQFWQTGTLKKASAVTYTDSTLSEVILAADNWNDTYRLLVGNNGLKGFKQNNVESVQETAFLATQPEDLVTKAYADANYGIATPGLWTITNNGVLKEYENTNADKAAIGVNAAWTLTGQASTTISTKTRSGIGIDVQQTSDDNNGNNYTVNVNEIERLLINDEGTSLISPLADAFGHQLTLTVHGTGAYVVDASGDPFQAIRPEDIITKDYADTHYASATPDVDTTYLWQIISGGYQKQKLVNGYDARIAVTSRDTAGITENVFITQNPNGASTTVTQTTDNLMGNHYNITVAHAGSGSAANRFSIDDGFTTIYSPITASGSQYLLSASPDGLEAANYVGEAFMATADRHLVTKKYADSHYNVKTTTYTDSSATTRALTDITSNPGQSQISNEVYYSTVTSPVIDHRMVQELIAGEGGSRFYVGNLDNNITVQNRVITLNAPTVRALTPSGDPFMATNTEDLITKAYADAHYSGGGSVDSSYLWDVITTGYQKQKVVNGYTAKTAVTASDTSGISTVLDQTQNAAGDTITVTQTSDNAYGNSYDISLKPWGWATKTRLSIDDDTTILSWAVDAGGYQYSLKLDEAGVHAVDQAGDAYLARDDKDLVTKAYADATYANGGVNPLALWDYGEDGQSVSKYIYHMGTNSNQHNVLEWANTDTSLAQTSRLTFENMVSPLDNVFIAQVLSANSATYNYSITTETPRGGTVDNILLTKDALKFEHTKRKLQINSSGIKAYNDGSAFLATAAEDVATKAYVDSRITAQQIYTINVDAWHVDALTYRYALIDYLAPTYPGGDTTPHLNTSRITSTLALSTNLSNVTSMIHLYEAIAKDYGYKVVDSGDGDSSIITIPWNGRIGVFDQLGDLSVGINLYGLAIYPQTTAEAGVWNVEWFGVDDNGEEGSLLFQYAALSPETDIYSNWEPEGMFEWQVDPRNASVNPFLGGDGGFVAVIPSPASATTTTTIATVDTKHFEDEIQDLKADNESLRAQLNDLNVYAVDILEERIKALEKVAAAANKDAVNTDESSIKDKLK